MIKAKSIDKIKKYYYSDCLIPELIKINEKEKFYSSKTSHEFKSMESDFRRIVDITEVFTEIIDLGTQIKNADKDNISNLIDNWINKNYFPYPTNMLSEQIKYKFMDDIKNIYDIYYFSILLKRIIKRKTLVINDINKLDKFITYVEIPSIISSVGVHYLEYEYFNYDNFLDLLNNVNKLSIDNKNEFCYSLLNILIAYIGDIINNPNYSITNTTPVIIRTCNKVPTFSLYKTSPCIIGVAYYKLLNILISKQNDGLFKSCNHCDTLFKAIGNQRHCDECIDDNIPKKNRDNSFRNSPKGKAYYSEYHRQRYQNKKKELKNKMYPMSRTK